MNIQHPTRNLQRPKPASRRAPWGLGFGVWDFARRDLSACRRRIHGFTLVEVLIYIGVLAIVLAAGYAAVIHSLDNNVLLRRNAGDIADALHAGENWRADVRATRGAIQVQTNESGEILLLPGRPGISYRFATNTVFRRLGDNDWSPVLSNVKSAAFVPDPRGDVPAWRWELELKPRAKKPGRIRPLFTFFAVPATDSD